MSRYQDPARWWFLIAPAFCLLMAAIGLVSDNMPMMQGSALAGLFWFLVALVLIKVW